MFGKPMYPGETRPQIGLATGKTPAQPKSKYSSKGDIESILPLVWMSSLLWPTALHREL